jgi:hypothetical protein
MMIMKVQVLSIQNQIIVNTVPLETKNQIKLKPVKDFIKCLLNVIMIVTVNKKVSTVMNQISKKEAKVEIKENNPIDMPEITEWTPNQEVDLTVVSITSNKMLKMMFKRSLKRK